jgi:hypothetical protein
MSEYLNAVGFIFNKVKTLIKKDNLCKYGNYYCQECVWLNNRPNSLGKSCNSCYNNSQYKIVIFKLKKEHFISSSLGIASNFDEAWDQFRKNIIYQKNGNYVISVGKNNKSHSFYANLIKAKKCKCCDSVLLYFKYNIITMLSCYDQSTKLTCYNKYENYYINKNDSCNPYLVASANINGNIAYDLKSDDYYNVRFFCSSTYEFTPYL